ncbi:PTS system mannose/fructose/sorbose family transporter subunit IID [Amphibacillus sp. Q70]|uniref:PTS system mannose/fructose/sorbose family transporter subunit IID n=1 Tax=Amphibacillus sp. Q70 TaxID=3453416 RepID=UPI003F845AD2
MSSNNKLTKKEIKQGFWRSFTTSHLWHFERQQHLSFGYSIIPIINKLYSNKKDRIEAYRRHLEFYNSQATMHPFILGVSASMEEENANNEDFDTSSINTMKAALMGPLAGIGDSLLAGTLRIIATGIAAGLSMAGNILGPILFLLIYNVPNITLRYLGMTRGYKLGSTIISKISGSDLMNKVTLALSIIGLMVIGSMIASTVHIATPLTISIGDGTDPFVLQETLDSIFPQLLPLAATLLLYYLNRKQVSILKQIISIMILGVLLGAIGILV